MIVYKTRKSLGGVHLGTEEQSTGWGSIRYFYDGKFFRKKTTLNNFGETLLKEILFDEPLYQWE